MFEAVGTIRPLVSALADMQRRYGGNKTLEEVDKTANLVTDMRALGDAMDANLARVTDFYNWAAPVVNALNGNPQCDADPGCVAGRDDLRQVVSANDGGVVTSLSELVRRLRETDGSQTLDEAVSGLGGGMESAIAAAQNLNPQGMEQKLNSLQQGADQLATGSAKLAEGVQLLVDQTRVMGSGLDQASAFLLGMKRDAADPAMAGFYIPPQILTQDEFKKSASVFVSEDGRTVRYLVQTALDPFSTAAMDQLQKIREVADSARPNTALADATISMVGATAVNNDIRTYYDGDILFIIFVTLIVVFLILVALLRAIVAPLYLVLSVILSYMSAVGIGVVFFQFILGQEIAWSLPGTAFLVLVAVGADYNLLLISRIRDESHLGIRSAVIRTVGSTGGVITSAGLIFAASMLGLMFSSINTVVQMGFIIGVGLLLDTFLVRTVTVPALAVLAGKANWWPSKAVVGKKRPIKRLAHPADDTSVRHLTGRRIELVSVFTGSPRDNGRDGDLTLPLAGTGAPPAPLPTSVVDTWLEGGLTSRVVVPLCVDMKGGWLLDPQCTQDYWDNYLTAATDVARKTNGHGAFRMKGRSGLASHGVAGTIGVGRTLTNDFGQTETLPALRPRHNRSLRTSKAKLLMISAAGLLTFAIASFSSDGSQLAVDQTGQGKDAAVELTPTAGRQDTSKPDGPATPAQPQMVAVVEPPPPPVSPTPRPIAPRPGEPVVAAPPPSAPAPLEEPAVAVAAAEPAAPLPNQPVLAAENPLAPLVKDSLRFIPEPIASPPRSPRHRRDSSAGTTSGTGEPAAGTGAGDGTATDGTGTGGSGTTGVN